MKLLLLRSRIDLIQYSVLAKSISKSFGPDCEIDYFVTQCSGNIYNMDRLFFTIGSLSGFICVALGSFAAHSLKARLSPDMLMTFETGVRYQMYHAFALIAVGLAHTRWPGAVLTASGWLFIGGTVLFSGSLYALGLSGVRWLGVITPIGGCALLVGWLCLGWAVWHI